MTRRSVFIATLLLAAIPPAVSASVPVYSNYSIPITLEKTEPDGEYVVSVFKDGAWKQAARISYDMYFRERSVDLESFAGSGETPVKVRLEQTGGGAAHVDAVLLGGLPPLEATCADGNPDLGKLAKRDFDVVDAFGKRFDLVFPVSGPNKVLSLTARVESINPAVSPFYFPRCNGHLPMNLPSDFYTYTLEPAKHQTPQQAEPFFQEFCVTGSGHPFGYTYGWVWNDDEYLYVDIDFTPDNTLDGGKDYAEVYVKTEDACSGYRVSVNETRWGRPEFTYTEAVPYQHKLYHFRIPLSAIGKSYGTLSLAFSAYGTAAQPVATVTIIMQAVPESGQPFSFTGDLGPFALIDDGNPSNNMKQFPIVPDQLGTLLVTESVPTDWALTSITCIDPGGETTMDLATATVTIVADAQENIVCTFGNTRLPRVIPKTELPRAVPALRWFGAVLLVLLVTVSGWRILRKRERAR